MAIIADPALAKFKDFKGSISFLTGSYFSTDFEYSVPLKPPTAIIKFPKTPTPMESLPTSKLAIKVQTSKLGSYLEITNRKKLVILLFGLKISK